jgi:cytochrome c peroxidase
MLGSVYKVRYEAIFGPMPDFSDAQRFPADGKPGTPQFDAMPGQDKDLVNRVYANLGKSLEAYVRKLAAGRAPFDDFINGSPQSLTPAAQRGMVAFTRHGCGSCHAGPTFTDEGFHDLGYPAKTGQPQDQARAGGLAFAGKWQFTSTSKFADPASRSPDASVGAFNSTAAGFRTPTLRNVWMTAPYGHDGSLGTLQQAIEAHARVLPGKAAPDAQDQQDIIELLRSLTGRPPQRPWNYWPGG